MHSGGVKDHLAVRVDKLYGSELKITIHSIRKVLNLMGHEVFSRIVFLFINYFLYKTETTQTKYL